MQLKKLMSRSIYPLFSIVFVFTFFIETLGFPRGHDIALAIICLLPLLLGVFYFTSNQNDFHIPKYIGYLSLLFLVFTLLSAFFATSFRSAILGVYFFCGLFSAFIFGFNSSSKFQSRLIVFLFSCILLFPIYGIITRNFIYPEFPYLIPVNGYQLVFAKFGLHNHLGDYIAVFLPTLSFYLFISKKNPVQKTLIIVLAHLSLLPYLLYSYSRTAYLTFMILTTLVFLIKQKDIEKNLLFFIAGFLIIIISFAFLTIREEQLQNGKNLDPIRNQLLVSQKSLWSTRFEFLNQAMLSIQEKPLLGFGFNNFTDASRKYTSTPPISTESSHNIFFDITAELGVVAGIIFFLLLVLIMKYADKQSVFFILSFGLLLTFQTDYTHRIYALIFLFFLVSGIAQQKISR